MSLLADAPFPAFVPSAERAAARPSGGNVPRLATAGEDDGGATFDLGGRATPRLTDLAGWEPSPNAMADWGVIDPKAAALRGEIHEGLGKAPCGIRTGLGKRIGPFRDPEGNALSLIEIAEG